MESLRITALQLDLKWHHAKTNREHITNLLSKEESKTDIIVLPEMFTTGFSMDAASLAENEDEPTLHWMQELASSHSALIMGSIIVEDSGNYFNRFFAVNGNGILAKYDKRHLFRMADEHLSYKDGEEQVIFTYKDWRICPQICYDLRFPVWSRNTATTDGYSYDLLVYVANWPSMRAFHWENLLISRAIENQTFVVGVNRVGKDGNGLPYSGDSVIIDYMGKKLSHLSSKEGILQATIEPIGMKKWREKFPIWKDADSFSIHINDLVRK